MPAPEDFRSRLYPNLNEIANQFGTPFHIYDEKGIRETVNRLQSAFADFQFREFFAVKALPNPHVMAILFDEGCGFDCSSIPELILASQVGANGDKIMFTSNNTTPHEFDLALSGGAILNLDDISLIEKVPQLPDRLSFRLNPGSDTGNAIIGKPEQAKFGVPREKILSAYQKAKERGVSRFGLHTMVVSNERDVEKHLSSVEGLCILAGEIEATTGIKVEFINIGGGPGIPYHPDEAPLDLEMLAKGIKSLWEQYSLQDVQLFMESGRYITAPHGVLITRAINHKNSYRKYIGVDASMSALMRPGMYGAYHHVDVLQNQLNPETEIVDIVGSLCENNDKFAIQRELPLISDGDLLVIHDTGAHGHSMGFNYNGRLRPQELLFRADGRVERIRRAETLDDYFATLRFEAQTWEQS